MEKEIQKNNKKGVRIIKIYERKGKDYVAHNLELNTSYREQCMNGTSPLYYVITKGLWGAETKDTPNNPFLPVNGVSWKKGRPFEDLVLGEKGSIVCSRYEEIKALSLSTGNDPYMKIVHQGKTGERDEIVKSLIPEGFEDIQRKALEDVINGNVLVCPHIIKGYSDKGYSQNSNGCFIPTNNYVQATINGEENISLMPGLIKIPEGAFYYSQLLNAGRFYRLLNQAKAKSAWEKLAKHYMYVGEEKIELTSLPQRLTEHITSTINQSEHVLQKLKKNLNKQ